MQVKHKLVDQVAATNIKECGVSLDAHGGTVFTFCECFLSLSLSLSLSLIEVQFSYFANIFKVSFSLSLSHSLPLSLSLTDPSNYQKQTNKTMIDKETN